MYLTPDYRDLIELFNEHQVRYLLAGAHAMAVFGYARSTYDIDIWVERSEKNAAKILEALEAFGVPFAMEPEYFLTEEQVVQIGVAPHRIDLLTDIDGVDFKEAWEQRETIDIDGMCVPVLHIDHLIKNKEATGREKDKMDVKALKEAKKRLKPRFSP